MIKSVKTIFEIKEKKLYDIKVVRMSVSTKEYILSMVLNCTCGKFCIKFIKPKYLILN